MVYGLRKGAGYNHAGVVGECQMPFECIDLFAFWFCSHSAVLFGKFVAPDAMVIEKNAVERKSQSLQSPFPDSRLQLAFPYCDAMPSHRGKLALVFYVTITVAFNLRFPEFSVALFESHNICILRVHARSSRSRRRTSCICEARCPDDQGDVDGSADSETHG